MAEPHASSTSWHRLEAGESGLTLYLAGEWRLDRLGDLAESLRGLDLSGRAALTLDGGHLEAMDGAAAMLLVRRLGQAGVAWAGVRFENLAPRQLSLLNLAAGRLEQAAAETAYRPGLLARLGWHSAQVLRGGLGRLGFLGHAAAAFAEALLRPSRFRPREFFVQLEMVGLRAIPLVVMMNALIGVVMAYLSGIQIEKYGANIFIVDGASLVLCRELSPVLVAVLVAGRSGAAFTAQLGAMKVTEEIDAIISMGLSAFQVLVLPRLLALVMALPLLVFVGDIAGLLGTMVVADIQLDVSYRAFIERLQVALELKTVVIGLAKSPFFAAAIALIACHNGLHVGRDARSVGLATTATVVQGIVAVIILDAIFAILLSELGL